MFDSRTSGAMRIRCLYLCLSLLLFACPGDGPKSTPTAAPTKAVSQKVGDVAPGQGVGEIQLGQTSAEVEEALGPPQERDANEFSPGMTYALYYRKGLELTYKDDKLVAIVLHREKEQWSAYPGATEDGLWVGSTPEEVKELLGPPPEDNKRALRYPKHGLWFRLDDTGQVDTLSVLEPE